MYYWNLWRKGSDIIFSLVFQLQNKLNLKIRWSGMQPKEYSFIHSLQPFENSLIILIMNELKLKITCESYGRGSIFAPSLNHFLVRSYRSLIVSYAFIYQPES